MWVTKRAMSPLLRQVSLNLLIDYPILLNDYSKSLGNVILKEAKSHQYMQLFPWPKDKGPEQLLRPKAL